MWLTIITFIVTLGILIIVHELGHFTFAKIFKVKVKEFAFGFPPRLLSKIKNGTRYSLNLIPIGGYVNLLGEDKEVDDPQAFSSQTAWKRFLILVMGVIGNFILAWVMIMIAFWLGSSPIVSSPDSYHGQKYDQRLIVGFVSKDSPAQAAGMQFGDTIISGDNKTFQTVEQFQNFTKENQGKAVHLVFRDNGKQISRDITLRKNNQDGALGVVVVEDAKIKYSWWKVPYFSLLEIGKTIGTIFVVLGGIVKEIFVSGKVTADVAGPVGIYNLTGEAVKLGFSYILVFIGFLSINLGIFNILPFPALDGGRILFILIEKLRGGKKVSPAVESIVHGIGFLLLIILVILITYRDVIRIFH